MADPLPFLPPLPPLFPLYPSILMNFFIFIFIIISCLLPERGARGGSSEGKQVMNCYYYSSCLPILPPSCARGSGKGMNCYYYSSCLPVPPPSGTRVGSSEGKQVMNCYYYSSCLPVPPPSGTRGSGKGMNCYYY